MRRWRKRNASSPASCALSGRTSSLRTRAVSRVVELRLLRRERLDGAVVEDLALDRRRARARFAPASSSWSSRAASRAWIVGGTSTSPSPDASHHRGHLLDEERVPAGGLEDPLPHVVVERRAADAALHQLLGLLGRAAAAGASTPPQPLRRSSSSGRAMQSRRIGAPVERNGDVLEEIEEDVLAPLDVVEDGDERLLGGNRLEQLAERPAISSVEDVPSAPSSDRERIGRDRIELEAAHDAARAASGPRRRAST